MCVYVCVCCVQIVGFCSSATSDTLSNSIRVIKVGMICSLWHCIAVCCCVLLCVASVLRCVSNTPSNSIHIGNTCMCCSVLQCVARGLQCVSDTLTKSIRAVKVCKCCSVLQCVAVCCSVLQCVAVCAVSKYVGISAQFARLFSQYVSSFLKAITCGTSGSCHTHPKTLPSRMAVCTYI